MKTYIAKDKDIHKIWYVVDAKDKILGRLASKVATVLMGKNKVIYSPHQDVGDEVVVINASKVKVTGNKLETKIYTSYSAHPGGLKETKLDVMMERKPEFVVRQAIKGMLPKTKLGAKFLKKLRVYAGDKHPHTAQKPQVLNIA